MRHEIESDNVTFGGPKHVCVGGFLDHGGEERGDYRVADLR